MINSIHKIQFSKSSYELNDDYDKLYPYEKEVISSLSCDGFFDYNDKNDRYTVYFITNSIEIKSYLKILDTNSIDYKYKNLSIDILYNKIDLLEVTNKLVDKTNYKKWEIFKVDINIWILSNLDIDVVLDRIIEVGNISLLKEIEIEFLNNYKK